ncbi:MAG: DUF3857 domain-containing protein [candidate division Zixibacteria bacterium]|nr:DUF3857 domain-containing protein [candidate division Zixibacteria bacterium]
MKTRIVFTLTIIVGLFFIFSPDAAAKKKDEFKWAEITPSDWKITQDSSKQITDAVIIFEHIIADDKGLENDKCYRTIYRRIRILTDYGRNWGDFDIPILNLKQKIESIQGRTITKDGKTILLGDEHIFEKEAIKIKRKKIKQTSFSMPGVTNDCIIEYYIKIKMPSYYTQWIIQKDIPVLEFKYRWVIPRFNITSRQAGIFEDYITPNYLYLNRYSELSVDYVPSIKKPKELVFTCSFVPPYNDEPFSLPADAIRTKLLCYLGSRSTALAYWGEKSNDVDDFQKDYADKNKRLRKVVEDFAGLKSVEEKISTAYNWVQSNIFNISYWDLPERNAKSKKIKKKDRKCISDVIKLGYGTKTEINRVFCDMLREMNIDAKMAFACDRDLDIFVEEAKYWQFDESLVIVKKGYKDFDFYSPGHAMLPINQMPWFIEGVITLVGGVESNLISIPFSSPATNTSTLTYDFTIDEDLILNGNYSVILKGQASRNLKVKLLDESPEDCKHLIKESLERRFDDIKLEVEMFSNLDSVAAIPVIKCVMEQVELEVIGDKVLFKPFSHMSASKNPFYLNERKGGVLLNYPYQLRESAQFTLPEDMIIAALPNDTSFKCDAGTCTVMFEELGGGLSVQRLFTLSNPFWTVAGYPSLQALYQARQDFGDFIVVLKESE